METLRDELAVSVTQAETQALFKFAPEADAERLAIENFVAQQIGRPDTPTALKQWLDKLPNEFGRLALVFHFIEHHASQRGQTVPADTPPLVSEATAKRAPLSD